MAIVTTSAKFATKVASVSSAPWSDEAWANTGSALAADNTGASVTATTYDAGDQTELLVLKGFDFSSVPTNSTINGVVCAGKGWYVNSIVSLDNITLLNTSGNPEGTNLCSGATINLTGYGTGTNLFTVGGTSNLWGNALTPTWIQDADFGVCLGCWAGPTGGGNTNNDVFVDYATLAVTYTEAEAPTSGPATSKITTFNVFKKTYKDIKPPLGSTLIQGHPLSQGLVGCWLMNEGGGNLVNNLVSSYPPTSNNGALWTPTQKGTGLKFNGTTSYVKTPDGGKIKDFVSGDVISIMFIVQRNAVEAWHPIITKIGNAAIKRNFDIVFQPIFSSQGTDNGLDFAYYNSSGQLNIWASNSVFTSLSKIYNFVFTYKFATGNSIKFYVDGVQQGGFWYGRTGDDAPVSSDLGDLEFGRSGVVGEYFNGNIVYILSLIHI